MTDFEVLKEGPLIPLTRDCVRNPLTNRLSLISIKAPRGRIQTRRMFINDFILKIKRAETPFYARLKRFGQAVLTLQLPIPRFLDPVYKIILYFRYLRYETSEKLSVAFFRYPVMRMLCVVHRKASAHGTDPCHLRQSEDLHWR